MKTFALSLKAIQTRATLGEILTLEEKYILHITKKNEELTSEVERLTKILKRKRGARK